MCQLIASESSPLLSVPLIVRMPSLMLTSRSSLLTPAVRALTTSRSSVSYTSTASWPGKSSSASSQFSSADGAAGAVDSVVVRSSSFRNAAASSSSMSKSSFCFRAMISSTFL
ncbi:hypothetical protein D9M69_539960 [compost metagenome]